MAPYLDLQKSHLLATLSVTFLYAAIVSFLAFVIIGGFNLSGLVHRRFSTIFVNDEAAEGGF